MTYTNFFDLQLFEVLAEFGRELPVQPTAYCVAFGSKQKLSIACIILRFNISQYSLVKRAYKGTLLGKSRGIRSIPKHFFTSLGWFRGRWFQLRRQSSCFAGRIFLAFQILKDSNAFRGIWDQNFGMSCQLRLRQQFADADSMQTPCQRSTMRAE